MYPTAKFSGFIDYNDDTTSISERKMRVPNWQLYTMVLKVLHKIFV